MFDFKNTESASSGSYLNPGVFDMKVTEVKLGEFPQKKTPYLGVTFTTDEGLSVTEKFPLSEAALPRLQYLHEAWSGRKISQAFKTPEEVEAYFRKAFVNPKAGTRKMIVGGNVNGAITYAALPYSDFIVPDDVDMEYGEFTEDSPEWKKYVKKSNSTSASSGKKNGALNGEDEDDDIPSSKKSSETSTGKAKPKPGAGKAKVQKEDDDSEEKDDDLPW